MKLHELNESFLIKGIGKVPPRFKKHINAMIRRIPDTKMYSEDIPMLPDDVVIQFGVEGKPNEKNTVNIGGKPFNKQSQYNKLRGKVTTIETYTDAIEGSFIAKKKRGIDLALAFFVDFEWTNFKVSF